MKMKLHGTMRHVCSQEGVSRQPAPMMGAENDFTPRDRPRDDTAADADDTLQLPRRRDRAPRESAAVEEKSQCAIYAQAARH